MFDRILNPVAIPWVDWLVSWINRQVCNLVFGINALKGNNVGQPRTIFQYQLDVRRIFPILDVVVFVENLAVERRNGFTFVLQDAR